MAAPFSDFVNFGPRASLYTPAHPESGHRIITCTILTLAPLRLHLPRKVLNRRFCSGSGQGENTLQNLLEIYQKIAPNARILLIQSAVSIMASSYNHQHKEIQSAASAILDLLDERTNKQPKILLHTFSNGGTNTATQLLVVLRGLRQKPLPLVGLLCDSCPAKGEYWKSYDAMRFSLPKGFASLILGPILIHGLLILLYTWIARGNEPLENLMRRTLLDTQTIGPGWESGNGSAGGDSAGRICYLFSKKDRMCHWEDVRGHPADARVQKWQTQEVLFEGSAHCARLRTDEVKYSAAMKATWDGTGVWRNPL
jgi:hypothetical protein